MSQQTEINEAIQAGKQALEQLDEVLEKVRKAKTASWLDILGGGFLVDLYKWRKLDQSNEELQKLQAKLSRFQDECHDVEKLKIPQLDISMSLQFFDIGFDNIFSDVMVKNKLDQLQSELYELKEQIEAILKKLQAA